MCSVAVAVRCESLKSGRDRPQMRKARWNLRRSRCCWHGIFCCLGLGGGGRQPLLYPPGQFVLPLRRHERVLAGHLQVGVASDLRCLDRAAADFLPPGDVGAAEGVRAQARKVATFGGRRLMQGVADAGVPQRLVMIPLLVKHPGIGFRAVRGGSFAESGGKVADAQDPAAVLALRATDVLVPDALLNLDGRGVEVRASTSGPTPPRSARRSRCRFR
jgi:hypothetical protein